MTRTRKFPSMLSALVAFEQMEWALWGNGVKILREWDVSFEESYSLGMCTVKFWFLFVDCDKWVVLDQPSLISNAARFGHSADVYNGEMYVFGGFNGLLLSDLLLYQTGRFPFEIFSTVVWIQTPNITPFRFVAKSLPMLA